MCVEGLTAILNSFVDTSVVGRSLDWAEGTSQAQSLKPDVVVVDMVRCPECGPTSPIESIHALEGLNTVILSASGSGPSMVDALEAGALGYITLDASDSSAVHSTIQAAARGEATLDSKLSTAVLARMRSHARGALSVAGSHDAPPTEREAEVLELLVRGCSNREISQGLHVSESTVKNHLHAIYSKLGVQSRSQAVSEAIRKGLVSQ